MIRTQIQIDEQTYEKLRQKAFAERKSLSAVIREILSGSFKAPAVRPKPRYRFGFVGMVRGPAKDVSERHDEYLSEGFRW